jgi:ribosomal protein S17
MEIEKKVWPEYYQKIIEGVKKYELRLFDFDCKEGDELILKEWDPKTKKYTGREVTKKVTYVLKTKDITFWPKPDIDKYGFQIISFE